MIKPKDLDALREFMIIDGQPITPEKFEELVEAFREKQKLEDKIKELSELVDNLVPLNERMKDLDEAIEGKDITEEQKNFKEENY